MMGNNCNVVDYIAYVLLIVGGLNWGLVGALDMNLVGMIFGHMSMIARVVYVLVGLSAVYAAFRWVTGCR